MVQKKYQWFLIVCLFIFLRFTSDHHHHHSSSTVEKTRNCHTRLNFFLITFFLLFFKKQITCSFSIFTLDDGDDDDVIELVSVIELPRWMWLFVDSKWIYQKKNFMDNGMPLYVFHWWHTHTTVLWLNIPIPRKYKHELAFFFVLFHFSFSRLKLIFFYLPSLL